MPLTITYEDVTTYYPRRVKKVRAWLGRVDGYGTSRTEARKALERNVEKTLDHLGERSYLVGDHAVFVLFYLYGWQYDIVDITKGRKSRQLPGGCGLNEEIYPTQHLAFKAMERHFRQYHDLLDETNTSTLEGDHAQAHTST